MRRLQAAAPSDARLQREWAEVMFARRQARDALAHAEVAGLLFHRAMAAALQGRATTGQAAGARKVD